MNKIIWTIILSLTVMQYELSANSNQAQEETYYWFSMQLGKILDKETGTNCIIVKNIGNEIRSGSYDQFIKEHRHGMKSGRVVLGPFSEISQAEKSRLLYKYAGSSIDVPAKELISKEDDSLYNFFYTKPFSEDFTQEINFERIPSRVTSGTKNEFMELLNEGLHFERLAIGPFINYELAEKAKFAFMKNGELDAENFEDSLKSQDLKMMAKKWKSLNLGIVKQSNNSEINKFAYRIDTKFPRKYFIGDATQIITIKAYYQDSFHNSSSSFTLQGEDVTDNNPVISYEMGTVYINVLYFDMLKTARLNGFLFESFIYNNSEMIELDPVYLEIKPN